MKRVVAYCRVSTEQDDQLNSLENQKQFFESYINNNLEWRFCGLYVDEGISGTSTKKRKGFNQMIKDAENKSFDLILTKEISRFARNTLDSIFYTRKLKALSIGVLFLNDNINTLEPDAELRLTIMSSIAQEESRKTSDRVRWGQKRQMEKGVVFGTGIYGYYLKNGKLTINEDEAKIVRLIFDLYLSEGMGTHMLCKELENRGIPSPSGSPVWKNPSILRMLRNEKYIGDLKQKKEITLDYLSHQRKVNEGEEEYVIIKNHHLPIIDRETWNRVQKEIVRRRTTAIDKSKHSNRYVWSGKIECAYCQSKFKRRINNRKSKNSQMIWQCAKSIKDGRKKINDAGLEIGCDCQSIHETVLQEQFLNVLHTVIQEKESIKIQLKSIIKDVIENGDDHAEEISQLKEDMSRITMRKMKLVELFTDNAITRQEFDISNDGYAKQLELLNNEFLKLNNAVLKSKDIEKKLSAIDMAVDSISGLDEFSDEVCKAVLGKVVVTGRDNISFFLKTERDANFFAPLSIHP